MILITELQYFPPVTLIKKAIDFSNVKFDIYDDHRKMSFRNRCVLAGGGGRVNLSIPLSDGRNQRKPMLAVRIDNKTDWQGQHWKTITSCYNRSPWFEFYKFEMEDLYRRPVDRLVDWNRLCWDWLMEKLDAGINASFTEKPVAGSGFGVSGSSNAEPQTRNPDPDYLDWRNKLMPKSIEKEFPEAVRYRQVFEDRLGFIPHLSILDLLFCEGRRTVEILKMSKIPI
jgi:hypothetical protein